MLVLLAVSYGTTELAEQVLLRTIKVVLTLLFCNMEVCEDISVVYGN